MLLICNTIRFLDRHSVYGEKRIETKGKETNGSHVKEKKSIANTKSTAQFCYIAIGFHVCKFNVFKNSCYFFYLDINFNAMFNSYYQYMV